MSDNPKRESYGKSETKRFLFNLFNPWSGLSNRQGDVMPSFGRLADAVKEIVEGGLGMLEAAGDKVFAYDDGSVCPVIDSIAGAEHGADAIIDY